MYFVKDTQQTKMGYCGFIGIFAVRNINFIQLRICAHFTKRTKISVSSILTKLLDL